MKFQKPNGPGPSIQRTFFTDRTLQLIRSIPYRFSHSRGECVFVQDANGNTLSGAFSEDVIGPERCDPLGRRSTIDEITPLYWVRRARNRVQHGNDLATGCRMARDGLPRLHAGTRIGVPYTPAPF